MDLKGGDYFMLWLDAIQIIIFILLVGLFVLPSKLAKTTTKLRNIYIVFQQTGAIVE